MRFPFFATNKRLNFHIATSGARADAAQDMRLMTLRDISNLRRTCRVLEGRVNKLEPQQHVSKVVWKYTARDWRRMNKERRISIFQRMNPAERQYMRKLLEVRKHGRKKGK